MWRRSVAVAFAVLLFSVLGCQQPRPSQPAATGLQEIREVTARTFRVERVVDGDTFVIVYDGEPTYVRLFGVNAPERRDRDGPAATEALRRLIDARIVRIEFPGKRKRDNFGRLLCRVYVDGLDVGTELIRAGHAVSYERP